jgi:hypothetical protein
VGCDSGRADQASGAVLFHELRRDRRSPQCQPDRLGPHAGGPQRRFFAL